MTASANSARMRGDGFTANREDIASLVRPRRLAGKAKEKPRLPFRSANGDSVSLLRAHRQSRTTPEHFAQASHDEVKDGHERDRQKRGREHPAEHDRAE